MASIRQRNGRWQARIIRKGHSSVAKTFNTKQDAERWARATEVALDQGLLTETVKPAGVTLAELMSRYVREVTPRMKGAKDDSIRLNALMRHAICELPVAKVTPRLIAEFRETRLKDVSPGTVIRELAYLSAIFNHARREWALGVDNPVSKVRKPSAPVGRDRTLSADEEVDLMEALRPIGRRSPWMLPLVQLALETAMRRGELLSLHRSDVDLRRRIAILADTKNGHRRIVPLSTRAVEVIESLPRSECGRLIPISFFAVAAAFGRAVSRAGIVDLRFHDLRHTAITRMADKLPNVIELAAVSGHKSLRMLQRYYHPKPEELALKLG